MGGTDDKSCDSHYVPRMHIYQFTETREFDDKHNPLSRVHIYRRGGNHWSTKNLSGIASADKFYEVSCCYMDDSAEDILANAESVLNKLMDSARSGDAKGTNKDVAIFYVSLLLARSVEHRVHIMQSLNELNSSADESRMQMMSIAKSTMTLLGYPLDEYDAQLIVPVTEEFFITSDVPVLVINTFEIIKEMCNIEEDSSKRDGYDREYLILCPISSCACVAIYYKDNKNTKTMIDAGYITVNNINRYMSAKAIEYLFSPRELSNEYLDIFENTNSTERKVTLDTILHIRGK